MPDACERIALKLAGLGEKRFPVFACIQDIMDEYKEVFANELRTMKHFIAEDAKPKFCKAWHATLPGENQPQ